MLKKFQVKNFKNFKDAITIDFTQTAGYQFNSDCIANSLISKMIIYGRNSTGKTNLGSALMDITQCLYGRRPMRGSENFITNADTKSKFAEFSYIFSFSEQELEYNYRRTDDYKLHDEELFLNKKKVFSCNLTTRKTNFINLGLIDAETVNTDRYVEALNTPDDETTQVPPFLRWVINNAALPFDSPLLALDKFVRQMRMMSSCRISALRSLELSSSYFYEELAKKERLLDFQNFLNTMGVECELVCKRMPDGQNQLYFKHNVLLPFAETASSGTLALTDLYRKLQVNYSSCSLIFMDEFDAFYHYEMAEKIVKYIKHQYQSCQVIFTTHNTNLMSNSLLRPDCLCILSGKGTLTQLCNATHRELREGHNLEKMYISGEFDKYE